MSEEQAAAIKIQSKFRGCKVRHKLSQAIDEFARITKSIEPLTELESKGSLFTMPRPRT